MGKKQQSPQFDGLLPEFCYFRCGEAQLYDDSSDLLIFMIILVNNGLSPLPAKLLCAIGGLTSKMSAICMKQSHFSSPVAWPEKAHCLAG